MIPPRMPEEKERFIALYKKAIEQNKSRKVVWTLGFRGQGDIPFYEDDPRYDTLEMRATLISEMIHLQKINSYDLSRIQRRRIEYYFLG